MGHQGTGERNSECRTAKEELPSLSCSSAIKER